MKKFLRLNLLIFVYIFTLSTVSFASFDDVKEHWCEIQINDFEEKNFINGYEDNTFRPDKEITRAELCKIVNSYMNYEVSGDWKQSNMDIAAEKGYLVTGKADDTITREEALVVLSRVMNIENIDYNLEYTDSGEISVWAIPSIKSLDFLGYIKGYGDNTIRPKKNMTRAEVVAVLYEYVGTGGLDIEPENVKFTIGYLSYNKYGIEFVEVEDEIELEVNDSITLAATVSEEDGDVEFEIVSGKRLIEFDDESLSLEAIKSGTAKIKATTTKSDKEIEILIVVKSKDK